MVGYTLSTIVMIRLTLNIWRLRAACASSGTCLIFAVLMGACTGGEPGGHGESTPRFTDITDEANLNFVHESEADDRLSMPGIMGGGAALFDFDNDGDLDIYLTNGDRVTGKANAGTRGRNRLYRREGDGRYTDVSEASGLDDPGYGMGVAVGDVDNDGDVDVFVTNYGPDRLYLNRGDGTFTDIGPSAGAAVDGWSASAAFCDFDRDGWLDLYVTRYVQYVPAKRCTGKAGAQDFCGPLAFRPVHDVVLKNEGVGPDGRVQFTDVSETAGIAGTFAAGLGLVCFDANGDGWQDVYVANDGYPNQLWINLRGGDSDTFAFRDDSLQMGVAYNLHGQAQAGMGVVADDLDGTGADDLFLTHLMNEANTLYGNLGGETGFRDISGMSGLGSSSMPYTGFGVVALDAELDGDLDLFIANGKVNVAEPVPGSKFPPPWNTLPEPNLIYLNDGSGRFSLPESSVGALTAGIEISRGVASGDIDGDGDIDLLVANLLDRVRLYRNDTPRSGHWLSVRALDPRLNRDALGAEVTVVGSDLRLTRRVEAASGYLSSHSPVVHFGVGDILSIERIEVRWPDGHNEIFPGGGVDRMLILQRGTGEAADG